MIQLDMYHGTERDGWGEREEGGQEREYERERGRERETGEGDSCPILSCNKVHADSELS